MAECMIYRRACVAAALTLLGACSALAQSSPYYIGVAQSLSYDSNVYRIDSSREAQLTALNLSKSDTISGTSLVGGVDQTIGRQRVYGSANLRANRYSNNKTLNNDSFGLNLALDWATVERLSGTLSIAADQNLAQFNGVNINNNLPETRANEVRTLQMDAKLRLGVVTRYTLEAALGHRERSYSAVEYADNEFKQNSASLGVRFRPSSLLNLGAALRFTDVKYPKFLRVAGGGFVSDHLKRQDIDLTATWQPSAISQFNARLSPTRTRHDRATSSDFSGLTGSASWAWQPTGKTRLTTTLSRDTGQSSDAVAVTIFDNRVTDESRTTTALALRANHELTGKISLNAGLSYADRALRNVQLLNAVPVVRTGADKTTTLSLGGRWLPTRSISVGCDLSAESRSSSNPRLSASLSGSLFGCYGQIVLQ